ncbi:uncharacterized protein TNCV_3388791 [Trichonephila clavipes]|nr:uncharacterized protein TNCV_3388791 [Trichonephila clavipes]
MWGSDYISRYSNEFVEWITDSNLVLLNTTVPTYRSSAGISLDIKSAYDSVYVDGLIYKCLQIGIAGNIANWIHKFLTSRSFQIKWRGYFSPKKLVPQGLAQGSVLSPILYIIYMHDIFETLESEVECLVYADGIFIFCSHKSLVAAVAEWYRYRTVACFVTGSSPVPLKTRRVGQRCTLNLSRAETSSRWCGVVVRRGWCQLRCRPRHLTMVQNYVVRRQKPSCS